MKTLLIAGFIASFLVSCSEQAEQAARKTDSTMITDTMPVLRPDTAVANMPVIPMDTAQSDMPVVRPPDSIKPK